MITKNKKFNTDLLTFLASVKDEVILFGTASGGKRAVLGLIERGLSKEKMLFCDNNPDKWGKIILGIKVLSISELMDKARDIPIAISSSMFNEISEQLYSLGFSNVYYLRELLYAEHFFLKYDDDFLGLLYDVKERCNMANDEKFTLYSSMKAVAGLNGEIAEVGVYKGGSARILCEYKGSKEIHLFDTFKGLPKETVVKDDLVKAGWLSDVDVDDVRNYLSLYHNVFIYPGLFPGTADQIKGKEFCLVHLDTDIFQGTIEGLKFFWPRMVRGGRIICHDYNNVDCPGVKRAFQEFFKDHPEMIIDIADTQAMLVK